MYEKNHYNEALEAFLILLMNSKTLNIQKPNPRRRNAKSRVVAQLLRVVNFSYNLCFRSVIAHWKGILEKYTLCHQNLTLSIV
jgi:hypothetical protein